MRCAAAAPLLVSCWWSRSAVQSHLEGIKPAGDDPVNTIRTSYLVFSSSNAKCVCKYVMCLLQFSSQLTAKTRMIWTPRLQSLVGNSPKVCNFLSLTDLQHQVWLCHQTCANHTAMPFTHNAKFHCETYLFSHTSVCRLDKFLTLTQ